MAVNNPKASGESGKPDSRDAIIKPSLPSKANRPILISFNRAIALINFVCFVFLVIWWANANGLERLLPGMAWLWGCGALSVVGLASSMTSLFLYPGFVLRELVNIGVHGAIMALPIMIVPLLPNPSGGGRPAHLELESTSVLLAGECRTDIDSSNAPIRDTQLWMLKKSPIFSSIRADVHRRCQGRLVGKSRHS